MRWNHSTRMATICSGFVAAATLGLLTAQPAQATFHLWEVSEVYSDATGTVQFIEFYDEFPGENFLTFANDLTSNTSTYEFTTDLPPQSTIDKYFLVGTTAYAALTGVPAPDYVIPNNFFSVSGDTLTLVGAENGSITFTGAQLPTDGLSSLNRAYNSSTTSGFTTATNSPTNFAGETGVVPEPATAALLLIGGAAAAMRRRSSASRRSPPL